MRAEVAIIGAGLAGAATAYHLARAGVRDLLLIEREAVPGAHASGRNAGLVRQALEDPILAAIATEGASVLRNPPPELAGEVLVRTTGSLLLCGPETAPSIAKVAGRASARSISHEEAVGLAPELEAAPLDAVYHTESDGVADIHALLTSYLGAARRMGARLETSCEVRSLILEGGRVAGLDTSLGRVHAGTVLDAGGAWAGSILRSVGADPPPLAPYRRHLFQSGPAASEPGRPWVWNVERGFYFRAEGNGYLVSGCDQDRHPPGTPAVEPRRAEEAAAKLVELAPGLSGLTLARSWACLRTFAADGRFVLGPEPAVPGYFYAAGLGGHGVTTSFLVGMLAARGVLAPEETPLEFRRSRFNS
jgi:glycine/D-amino acid oxidase-like deaminating enzyme